MQAPIRDAGLLLMCKEYSRSQKYFAYFFYKIITIQQLNNRHIHGYLLPYIHQTRNLLFLGLFNVKHSFFSYFPFKFGFVFYFFAYYFDERLKMNCLLFATYNRRNESIRIRITDIH